MSQSPQNQPSLSPQAVPKKSNVWQVISAVAVLVLIAIGFLWYGDHTVTQDTLRNNELLRKENKVLSNEKASFSKQLGDTIKNKDLALKTALASLEYTEGRLLQQDSCCTFWNEQAKKWSKMPRPKVAVPETIKVPDPQYYAVHDTLYLPSPSPPAPIPTPVEEKTEPVTTVQVPSPQKTLPCCGKKIPVSEAESLLKNYEEKQAYKKLSPVQKIIQSQKK